MKKKVLISTGGSGGHVLPAVIVHDHLKSSHEIIISTDLRGLKFLEKENYNTIIINTPKLSNLYFLPNSIIKIFILTLKSYKILKKENISILVSTGGYMSLPLCLAAKLLNIKIFLIEPNMVLGRANKFFLNFSKKIICYSKNLKNFPKKFDHKITLSKPLIRKKYYENIFNKKDNNLFTILIIGGSQGANIFDTLFSNTLVNIAKICSLKIIHQTNEENIDVLKQFYNKNNILSRVFTFDQNLINLMIESDLCITRGGASSLAELSLINLPFIVIPLPNSKDNHQYENALYYESKKACWIFDQNNFDEKKFEELLSVICRKNNEFIAKKINLKKLNYQNTWNSVNQKLLETFNEY